MTTFEEFLEDWKRNLAWEPYKTQRPSVFADADTRLRDHIVAAQDEDIEWADVPGTDEFELAEFDRKADEEDIMERTPENIEKVARTVIKAWDKDTLIAYAMQTLVEEYSNNQALFDADVEKFAGELS